MKWPIYHFLPVAEKRFQAAEGHRHNLFLGQDSRGLVQEESPFYSKKEHRFVRQKCRRTVTTCHEPKPTPVLLAAKSSQGVPCSQALLLPPSLSYSPSISHGAPWDLVFAKYIQALHWLALCNPQLCRRWGKTPPARAPCSARHFPGPCKILAALQGSAGNTMFPQERRGTHNKKRLIPVP